MIPRRRLGAQGAQVSALGIGAMSFAKFYNDPTTEEAHAILDAALEAGVDHIDTANVYGAGRSEEVIGQYLARYRGKGELPFQLATKAAITRDPDTGARAFVNTAAHLEAELDKSLTRLGVERVALFYVHRRDPDVEIEEVTETLAAMVAKGKIGAFGFSEIAPASLRRAAAVHPVAAVQSEYSLQTRVVELGLLQACEDTGTALVAFSPLGRGLLTNDPPDAARVAQAPFLASNPRFMGKNLDRNLAESDRLRALASEVGAPAAALAIAWLLDRSPCVIPIPGTRDTNHFAEAVAGCHLTMTDDLRARIDAALPPGWAHGNRYSVDQSVGPEHYC